MLDILLVIFSALMISMGFFFIRNIDRDFKQDTQANMIFFGGIILIGLGVLILVYIFSWPILKRKLIGLLIAGFGYWLAFRFPDVTDYQQESFGWTGVLIGVAVMIIGAYFLLV